MHESSWHLYTQYLSLPLNRGGDNIKYERYNTLVKYNRELKIIVHIDLLEEENQSSLRLWKPDMELARLKSEMKKLIYALKRIKYGTNTNEQETEWILANYSVYAVAEIYNHYIK